MNGALIDWEDTLTVKRIANEAGITLAQAVTVLAALGELPAVQAIRLVGTAKRRRKSS